MSLNHILMHRASEIPTAALRLLPAEMAHDLGLFVLKNKIHRILPRPAFQTNIDLSMKVKGIGDLPHPIGLAAGFDKNGVAIEGFNDLGFSFLEIGTVTPRPQAGNSKPRIFRLSDQSGIINRMGFNNHGIEAMKKKLEEGRYKDRGITFGINLGKNKDTSLDHAISDYMIGLRETLTYGSYFVINISSPNTPGLRELASEAFLNALAAEIRLQHPGQLSKIWVKMDPDLGKQDFQAVVEVIAINGFAGLVLTNTHRVEKPHGGGQSGHSVGIMSTLRLEWAYEVTRGKIPMIGVGGILSGIDIYEKVIRGASIVQIYSAMIYRGPWTVQKMLMELEWELKLRGFNSLKEAYATYYGSKVER